MPILVAPVGIPEPPAPPAPVDPPTPQIDEAPQVTFTDPSGGVIFLSDWQRGWVMQPGPKGLDMPAYAMATDESPGIDGVAVRQVRAQAKEIVLPIAFWADDSRAAYLTRRRDLIRRLNPKRGPGTISITQADGSTRSIAVYYTGGMEGDESRDAAGMRWCMTVLTFTCPSPYWLGEAVQQEWRTGASGNFFPLLPLIVRDSQVLGAVTVDNDGDDTAHPTWTVDGPATSVSLSNATTGESLLLTHTISSSDQIVIDTRERRQTALLNGATNLWPDLSSASALWALDPGVNDLTLTVSGSTSDTRVGMSYQPRYLAA